MIQLHHAGTRSPAVLINGSPLGPSPDKETSARALTTTEVETLRDGTYDGSLENRARLIHEIIDGISAPCSDEFIIGLHLSPERFGIRLDEVIPLTQQFIDRGHLDFLDMSLWDCFEMIDDPACQYRSLISAFTELDRKDVLLTVAGKIYQPPDAVKCMQAGADFVTLGRVAIVHYDYPQ